MWGLVALGTLAACGNLGYARQADRTAEKLANATQADAAEWAAYEVILARAYLQKAAEEAADAEYEYAFELARAAEVLADRAQQRAPGAPKRAP